MSDGLINQSSENLAPIPEPGFSERQGVSFVPHRPERPAKLEESKPFHLVSDLSPSGDQPQAIEALVAGIEQDERDQLLLGVTGSGKTFTMAQVIARTQRPTLVLAPNKTLAAQLYGEFKCFFPENAVEYFVSYYDYYQPEAYIARTDTYIAKESNINEQIDRMRHSATRALLEREDVIIVASVSSIYGIGSVESYSQMRFDLEVGMNIPRTKLLNDLVSLQYTRNDLAFARGCFRVRGDIIEVYPAHYENRAWRIELLGDELELLHEVNPLTGEKKAKLERIRLYANSHYVTPRPTLRQAMEKIKIELKIRLQTLQTAQCLVEAQRLKQRTEFDLEMIETTGSCAGIENYSRYLTGREAGYPPPTLYEYLPDNALVFIDESHVTIPQIRAMFRGDFKRKSTLAQFGFRLPSCVDNRPMKFEEWDIIRPQTIHVSATPGKWEIDTTKGIIVEQIIRPTGLLDPPCEIRPATLQVDDLIGECHNVVKHNHRILVTTLTKRMAEDLTEYMDERGLRVRYMHADINTLERIEIIRELRLGTYDILIGINLLREGLDIPECALVAILDADKEGFLRSETSIIQTIGRAARNAESRVILYADKITDSIKRAIGETNRRRTKQQKHNDKYGIKPNTIQKDVNDIISHLLQQENSEDDIKGMKEEQTTFQGKNLKSHILKLTKEMHQAADDLEFEKATKIRDKIDILSKNQEIN